VKLFFKNIFFTLLIAGTVAVYAPWAIAWRRGFTTSRILWSIGILLLLAGLCVYGWTVWDFGSFGRGTPLPVDAPKKLVVRGLYRHTRNPMYIGVMLVILGWASLFADAWLLLYALGVFLVIHLFVIGYEEPHLKRQFGDDYIRYMYEVGRWIPAIFLPPDR
jgi:protein-S-isoprenylcysteine O-methyltransferase Ste14